MDIVVNNMKEFDIEEISKQFDFSSNSLKDNGNGVLLTVHEIEVLKANDIDYKNCHSLKEVLFLIEELLGDSDIVDEELDLVSSSIAERDYYQNTNK